MQVQKKSHKTENRLNWATVVAWMGVIFYLSSMPGSKVKTNIPDYVPHFIEYAVLGYLVFRALTGHKKEPPGPLKAGWAITLCIIYAVSDELHQLFIPGRYADPKDLAVDAVGVMLIVLLVYFIRARRTRT